MGTILRETIERGGSSTSITDDKIMPGQSIIYGVR